MYWQLKNLPELQHLSNQERRQLVRFASGRGFTLKLLLRSIAIGLFVTLLIVLLAGAILIELLGVLDTFDHDLIRSFSVLIWGAISVACYQISLIRIRGQIRLYLHEQRQRGERSPVCLKCGYAIADGINRCSECGAAV